MGHDAEERKALGQRLATARKLAGHTLDSAAAELTQRGTRIGKAAVGAWEVGRNMPDALWVRRLARLYSISADTLLGLTVSGARGGASEDVPTKTPQIMQPTDAQPVRSTGGVKRREPSIWNAKHHPGRRATDKKGGV